jgi:hypothetical protein
MRMEINDHIVHTYTINTGRLESDPRRYGHAEERLVADPACSWVSTPARYDILVANRFAPAAAGASGSQVAQVKSQLIPRCGTIEKGVFSLSASSPSY